MTDISEKPLGTPEKTSINPYERIQQDRIGLYLVSTVRRPDGWYETGVFDENWEEHYGMRLNQTERAAKAAHNKLIKLLWRDTRFVKGRKRISVFP